MIKADGTRTEIKGSGLTLIAEIILLNQKLKELITKDMPEELYDTLIEKGTWAVNLKEAGMTDDEVTDIITGDK